MTEVVPIWRRGQLPWQTDRRLKTCVERWPECHNGAYDPNCCRFPKSCSCSTYSYEHVTEEDLELVDSPEQESVSHLVTNEEVEAALTAQMLFLMGLEDKERLHETRLGMVRAGIERVLQMRKEAQS